MSDDDAKGPDWNLIAKAILAMATVLGTLFANFKSCANQQSIEEYQVEVDSLTFDIDARDQRIDSIVVAMRAHDKLHKGGEPKQRRVVRRVVRSEKRPWWRPW